MPPGDMNLRVGRGSYYFGTTIWEGQKRPVLAMQSSDGTEQQMVFTREEWRTFMLTAQAFDEELAEELGEGGR